MCGCQPWRDSVHAGYGVCAVVMSAYHKRILIWIEVFLCPRCMEWICSSILYKIAPPVNIVWLNQLNLCLVCLARRNFNIDSSMKFMADSIAYQIRFHSIRKPYFGSTDSENGDKWIVSKLNWLMCFSSIWCQSATSNSVTSLMFRQNYSTHFNVALNPVLFLFLS